jgi:hypothetical protein
MDRVAEGRTVTLMVALTWVLAAGVLLLNRRPRESQGLQQHNAAGMHQVGPRVARRVHLPGISWDFSIDKEHLASL